MDEQFGLSFGAFADPIQKQLDRQGVIATGMPTELAEKLSGALIVALTAGILTDAEVRKARRRLLKRLKVVKKEANK